MNTYLRLIFAFLLYLSAGNMHAMVPETSDNIISQGIDELIENILAAHHYDDIDAALLEITNQYANQPDYLASKIPEIIAATRKSYPIAGSYIIESERIKNIERQLNELASHANIAWKEPLIEMEDVAASENTQVKKRKPNQEDGEQPRKKMKVKSKTVAPSLTVNDLFAVVRSDNFSDISNVSEKDLRENAFEKDKQGNTLLHYAAKNSNNDLVLRLLKVGAKTSASNNRGKVPYDFVAARNRFAIGHLLDASLWKDRVAKLTDQTKAAWDCNICFRVFKNQYELVRHVRSNHANTYLATKPNTQHFEVFTFPNRLSFLRYFKECGKENRHTYCEQCNFWAFGITAHHDCKNFYPEELKQWEKELRQKVFSSTTQEQYKKNITAYVKNFTLDNAPDFSNHDTLLGHAIATNNGPAMLAILLFKPDIFSPMQGANAPINHAIKKKNHAVISVLVAYWMFTQKANPYFWDTFITSLIKKGEDLTIIKTIVGPIYRHEKTNDFWLFNSLKTAIERNDHVVGGFLLQLLRVSPLKTGNDVFQLIKLVKYAVKLNNEHFVRELLKPPFNPEHLIYCFVGVFSCTPLGPNDGWNALNVALNEGNPKIISLLFSYTTDIEKFMNGGGFNLNENGEFEYIDRKCSAVAYTFMKPKKPNSVPAYSQIFAELEVDSEENLNARIRSILEKIAMLSLPEAVCTQLIRYCDKLGYNDLVELLKVNRVLELNKI